MPDRFYDGQRGPDIRRELNNLEAVFDDAIANARGPQGWAPVVAVVTDGARRVLQITDWTGGEGSKPTVTGFIGATGIVATAALAVDIRGSIGATGPGNTLAIGTVTSAASPSATITGASPNQTLNLVLPKGDKGDTGNTGPANTLTIGTVTTGAASATITGAAPSQVLNLVVPQGIQGIQGIQGPKGDTGLQGIQGPKGDTGSQGIQGVAGLHGWTPKFAVVTDGTRRVQQVVDWFGGTGSKPATGEYVGATGLVATVAQAVDIRGPSGAGTGSVNPSGTIAANDLAAFADASGQVIKALKAADLPVSTATQTALNGKAPLTGAGTSGTWPISITGGSVALSFIDNRAVDEPPSALVASALTANFKNNTAIGNPPVNADSTYSHILNLSGWDAFGSGGYPSQMSVGAGGIAVRQGTSSTAWGPWVKLGLENASTTGNAATATKLATARAINGVNFDGTANISVPVDWSAVTGKPAVIAAGADKALARAAIDAVSVYEVITPFVLVTAVTQPAVAGVQYGLSNAAVTTLTLPASPIIESLVWVVILNNRSDNVLARNGSLIGGLAEDMTIDNPKRPFAVKFIGGAIGWVIL